MLWQIMTFKEAILISDVHAHLNTFVSLIDKVRKQYGDSIPVVVIGDMIDKGKRAKELVELIKNDPNIYAILGNHDHLMTIENRPSWKKYQSLWLDNNGAMTHRSYGGKWKLQNKIDYRSMFYSHVNWFKSLPLVIELPNIEVNGKSVVLSHAGLDMAVQSIGSVSKIKEILTKDDSKEHLKSHWKDTTNPTSLAILEILWNKYDANKKFPDLGVYNIFGHTTQENVLISDNFACIDTHVYKPNKLSALHIPSMNVIEQETIEDSWGEK